MRDALMGLQSAHCGLYKIGNLEISPQCTLKRSFSSFKGALYGKGSVHEMWGPIVSTKWNLIYLSQKHCCRCKDKAIPPRPTETGNMGPPFGRA